MKRGRRAARQVADASTGVSPLRAAATGAGAAPRGRAARAGGARPRSGRPVAL